MKIFLVVNQVADMELAAVGRYPFEALAKLDKVVSERDPKNESGRMYNIVELEVDGDPVDLDSGTMVNLG